MPPPSAPTQAKSLYSSRELSREQVLDLIDRAECIETDTGTWRWGHSTTYVTPLLDDGKHWRFTVRYHTQDGVQLDSSTTAYEVKPQDKVVTEWVRVPLV